jgi:uncharacterized Zn finger protein
MNNGNKLLDLVAPSSLKALAGSRSFQLGQEYFKQDAVSDLVVTAAAVRAHVAGTESYRVALREHAGELSYYCTCRHATDGNFCKHCVAVAFAWLASMDELPEKSTSRPMKKQRDARSTIERYLRKQETDALIALVLDAAQRDDRMYRALLLRAERDLGDADLSSTLRATIDEATSIAGFVAWDEVGEVVETLDEIVDTLAELLRPATGGMLVALLEYAIARVEAMLEEVDDSGGGVGEIVARLGALHLEACRMSQIIPEELAERLFGLAFTLPFGIWGFDPLDYRDALGEKGMQRYRELAFAKWHTDYDTGSATITRIMERLAEESGDIQQLVDIKSRDLSFAFRYYAIAELLHKAGEVEQALDWAERGLAAFPVRTDNRLRDFLVGFYLQNNREDEAFHLTWVQFEENPSLHTYQKLANVSKTIGRWQTERERALSFIDTYIAAMGIGDRFGRRPAKPDMSLRVAIALWESDLEAAWLYANLGVSDRTLLIELAARLEGERLDDAIELYRRIVPVLLEQTSNAAYEEALGLVKKMAAALNARQREQEMVHYLKQLRVEFKRKRNFVTLLDRFVGAQGMAYASILPLKLSN